MPTVPTQLRQKPLGEGEERMFNFPNGCVKATNGVDGKVGFSYGRGSWTDGAETLTGLDGVA